MTSLDAWFIVSSRDNSKNCKKDWRRWLCCWETISCWAKKELTATVQIWKVLFSTSLKYISVFSRYCNQRSHCAPIYDLIYCIFPLLLIIETNKVYLKRRLKYFTRWPNYWIIISLINRSTDLLAENELRKFFYLESRSAHGAVGFPQFLILILETYQFLFEVANGWKMLLFLLVCFFQLQFAFIHLISKDVYPFLGLFQHFFSLFFVFLQHY